MPRFEHHVFFCENERTPNDPRGSCRARGSEALRAHAKERCFQRGLKGKVRINSAGCLDACAQGPAVVVYGAQDAPAGVWYTLKTREDVDEVIDRHLQGGAPVEHLRMSESPKKD